MPEPSSRRSLPEWLWVAGLLGLALALRLLYVWQIKDNPLVVPNELDPGFYYDWAKEIAAGAWLGKAPFVQSPLYAYLLALFMKVAGAGVTRILVAQSLLGCGTVLLTYAVGRRLFDRTRGLLAGLLIALYGPFIFYEGMVMKTFLSPFLTILLVLLFDLARQRAGEPAGAGTVRAEGAGGRRAAALFALCGAVFGLLTLDRDNFVLLLPVLAGLAFALGGGRRGAGLRAAAAFTLGTALLIAPVTLRNWAVSKELVLLTTGGGEVFFIGNNADANGLYAPPPFVRPDPQHEHADFIGRASEISGRTLSPMESSWFWFREGMKFIAEEPLSWVLLLWRKTIHFWNAFELPDNLDYAVLSQFSSLLRWLSPVFPPHWAPTLSIPAPRLWLPVRLHLFATFGTLAPLGLVGIYLSRRQWRRLLPLYVLLFGYAATVLLFFNFSRFRVPVVPILALFAAETLVALGRFALRIWPLGMALMKRSGEIAAIARSLRPGREEAWAGGLLLVFLVFVNIEYPRGVVPRIEQALVLGNAYYEKGEPENALQAFTAGLVLLGEVPEGARGDEILRATLGGNVTREGLVAELQAEAVAKGPQFQAIHVGIHHGLGISLLVQAQALMDGGKRLRALPLADRAIVQFDEALKIIPSYLLSLRKKAQAFGLKGDTPKAIEVLRAALDLWPEDFQARLELAEILFKSGDFTAALRHLDAAYAHNREMDPGRLAQVHFNRGLIFLNGLNQPGKALYNLERAIELRPDSPQAAEINRTIVALRAEGYLPLKDEAFDPPADGTPPGTPGATSGARGAPPAGGAEPRR